MHISICAVSSYGDILAAVTAHKGLLLLGKGCNDDFAEIRHDVSSGRLRVAELSTNMGSWQKKIILPSAEDSRDMRV